MKIKKNWIKAILFLLIVAAAGTVIYLFLPTIWTVVKYIVKLFLPFIFGYIFSLAVNPLADFLQKKLKIPRGFSAILVILLIVGLLGSLVAFIIWKIISEGRELYMQFPMIYENIRNEINSFGNKWWEIYSSMPDNIQNILSSMGENISHKVSGMIKVSPTPVVDHASDFAKAIPSGFIAVVVFLLSSYFMVTEHKAVKNAVKKIFSEHFVNRLGAVKRELKKYLGGYLKAQVILMFIAFGIIFIGLCIFNIKYALLIAIGIAIIDALPFFGSGAVLWPWALIAFLNGNIKLGIGLFVIYIAVTIVRRFAEPKLISSGMGMHPILTLMSMYIGYKTMSIGGLILGPIILILILSFYKAKVFDSAIHFVKMTGALIKKQCRTFKKFCVNLMESDEDE